MDFGDLLVDFLKILGGSPYYPTWSSQFLVGLVRIVGIDRARDDGRLTLLTPAS